LALPLRFGRGAKISPAFVIGKPGHKAMKYKSALPRSLVAKSKAGMFRAGGVAASSLFSCIYDLDDYRLTVPPHRVFPGLYAFFPCVFF
jgi:hypothetical protein